jgi:rubrerythrin
MLTPSWRDTDTLDDFFIKGRNMWPDLKELRELKLDRAQVPDDVVRFIRSTALNEHGIVHYVKQYLRSYGDDYKLGIWAAMWGGEEYLHSVVLRLILTGLGESISDEQYRGLEVNRYGESYDAYLDGLRLKPHMSARMQQLIYGVVQEFAAVIAYSSVADACTEPTVAQLLRRIAKDEMRHCRFFQLCLEALAENSTAGERALIWPQFNALFKNFQMPQEHIDMFREQDMGTDLYTRFWTPQQRSRLVLFLTHYFQQFRQDNTPASSRTDQLTVGEAM